MGETVICIRLASWIDYQNCAYVLKFLLLNISTACYENIYLFIKSYISMNYPRSKAHTHNSELTHICIGGVLTGQLLSVNENTAQ